MLVAPRGEGAPALTTTILCQEQVTSEELKVDKAIRSALPAGTAQMSSVWGGTLYEKTELPFRADLSDLPDLSALPDLPDLSPTSPTSSPPFRSRCS